MFDTRAWRGPWAERMAMDSKAGSGWGQPNFLLCSNCFQDVGLKLEAQRGPVEFLVIDKVEQPIEN